MTLNLGGCLKYFAVFLVLSLFLILISGCKQSNPNQKIIEKSQLEDNSKEDVNIDQNPKIDTNDLKDSNNEEENLSEKENIPEKDNDDSDVKGIFPAGVKGSAFWAYHNALPIAKEWSDDASFFSIEGVNIKEGLITSDHYFVSDKKFYQSYYIVKFLSSKKDWRETLEVKITWEGPNPSTSKSFIPSRILSDYYIKNWKIDSIGASKILNDNKQGSGYFIKKLDIYPLKFIKNLANDGSNNFLINTKKGQIKRSEIYSSIKDTDPVAIAELSSNLRYEIDLSENKIIGYYNKKS